MVIRSSKKYNKKTFYKCKSKTELGIECGNDVVYENFLEEGVIKLVEKLANLSKEDIYKEILNITISKKDNIALTKIDNQIKDLKTLIDKYSKEFENLLLKGIAIPDALAKKLNDYETKLKQLEEEKEKLLIEANKVKKEAIQWEEFIELLANLKQVLNLATLEEKKSLYKSLIDKIIYKKGKAVAIVKGKEFELEYRPRIIDLSDKDIEYLKSLNTDRAKILLLASQTYDRNEIAEKLDVSLNFVNYVISKWKEGRRSFVKINGEPKGKPKYFDLVKEFIEKNHIDVENTPAYKLADIINKETGLNLSEYIVRSCLYELGKRRKMKF